MKPTQIHPRSLARVLVASSVEEETLTPDDVLVYETRGRIFLSLGDYNSALDDFNHLIELDPNLAEGYILRATAQDELNRYDEAIASLDEALTLATDVTDIATSESLRAELLQIPPAVNGVRTWNDTIFRFNISYPDTWRQQVDPGSEVPVIIIGPLDKDYRATALLLSLDIGFTTDATYISWVWASDIASLPDYEEVSLRSINFGGRSAIQRVFTWTATDERLNDISVTVIQVYMVVGEQVYILTATCRTDDLSKYQTIFDNIITSFMFS